VDGGKRGRDEETIRNEGREVGEGIQMEFFLGLVKSPLGPLGNNQLFAANIICNPDLEIADNTTC
jgi:hypothetical protein